ncbi:MAG: LLM class flavin-dependent oxidoreductase [Candidatus Dormibacteraceae bacterium]
MYPVGFAGPEDVVRVAVEAEELGFWEVAGNDHFSTQAYVRETFAEPPDFFDPLITFAYCAARTSRLHLMTGIVVLPMREPVVLAKQLATLDCFCGGRLLLGVGIGAYREEFEAAHPELSSIPRAELLEEGILALRSLFEARRSTFDGAHFRFTDLEMYPKPRQRPLPIYSAGNAEGSIRRAAELGQGWLPAGIGPERIRDGRARLTAYARAAGRDPASISIAPQLVVCLGPTDAQARETFERSQLYHHLVSLQRSTLRGVDVETYTALNLVGTPEGVCRKVDELRASGADHLCGLYFVGNTVEEMMSQAREFARSVMPAFVGDPR